MSKIQDLYVCSNCDAQSLKWSGRCLECGSWGTLKKQSVDLSEEKKNSSFAPAEIIDLAKIKKTQNARLKTDVEEIDRVLGGGFVPGSLVLISGEPGVGKSTILAQIANTIAKKEKAGVVYVSGEESAGQVKDRLERLNCDIDKIKFIADTQVEKIISALEKQKPALAIIDSIQTVKMFEIANEAGGVNQIKASTAKFLEFAKKNNVPIVLVGHITKDGQVAGPKSLEHIVDTVLYLEDDSSHRYRVLRAVKNRFGSVNELGLFEMTGKGFCEIKNPSAIFVDDNASQNSGSISTCIIEGTRPFLLEVQALVSKTVFGYPQRKSSGFDVNRLQVLSAVLTKRANINLSNQDIILNIVGGLKVSEPALDLAVAWAIISSLLNQKSNEKIIVLGEIGLGGEIRQVDRLEQRLKEAQKLGFEKAIIPKKKIKIKNMEIVNVANLADLKNIILQK